MPANRNSRGNPDHGQSHRADPASGDRITEQLADRGIDFQTVAAQAGKPDADPFDLLCHLACNAPALTRRQRANRMKQQQAGIFAY